MDAEGVMDAETVKRADERAEKMDCTCQPGDALRSECHALGIAWEEG